MGFRTDKILNAVFREVSEPMRLEAFRLLIEHDLNGTAAGELVLVCCRYLTRSGAFQHTDASRFGDTSVLLAQWLGFSYSA